MDPSKPDKKDHIDADNGNENMKKKHFFLYFLLCIVAIFLMIFFFTPVIFPQATQRLSLEKIAMAILFLTQIALLCNIILSLFIHSVLHNMVETEAPIRFTLFQKDYIALHKKRFFILGLVLIFLFGICFIYLPYNFLLACAILFIVCEIIYWMRLYLRLLYKVRVLTIQSSQIIKPKLDSVPEPSHHINIHLSSENEPQEVSTTHNEEPNYTYQALAALLKNKAMIVRKNAIKTLGKTNDKNIIPILIPCLSDEAAEVRAQVANTFGKMKIEGMQEPLKCLAHDESLNVRVAAIEALGHLLENNTSDIVIQALEDPEPEVRGAAAEAIGNLALFEGVEPLLGQIRDNDWFVRHKVVIALGRVPGLPSQNMIEKLIQATKDEHPDVARTSKHVIQKIWDEFGEDLESNSLLKEYIEQEQKELKIE